MYPPYNGMGAMPFQQQQAPAGVAPPMPGAVPVPSGYPGYPAAGFAPPRPPPQQKMPVAGPPPNCPYPQWPTAPPVRSHSFTRPLAVAPALTCVSLGDSYCFVSVARYGWPRRIQTLRNLDPESPGHPGNAPGHDVRRIKKAWSVFAFRWPVRLFPFTAGPDQPLRLRWRSASHCMPFSGMSRTSPGTSPERAKHCL